MVAVDVAPEQRVPHGPADEVEPVSGGGEAGSQLVGDRVDRDQVHHRILLGAHELRGHGRVRNDGGTHGAPV